jgi:serine protease inhibitor
MSLMHRHANMSYVDSPTYQAVDLPYGNTAFTMTVVLPKPNAEIETVAASLTPASWRSLTSGFHSVEVDLSLPKLKLAYERDLIDDLEALGMKAAFNPDNADFSRMSPESIYISLVKQKTFVDINEEGTEAAAVTAVGGTVTCDCFPTVMRVDRPYIFVIRERLSGTVVFMGKIARMP